METNRPQPYSVVRNIVYVITAVNLSGCCSAQEGGQGQADVEFVSRPHVIRSAVNELKLMRLRGLMDYSSI
jgi:hypothetical protein